MVAVLALLSILTHFGTPVAAAPKSRKPQPVPSASPRPHVRASEVHGTPLVKPSPKPPRVRGVRSTPQNTQPLALNPKPAANKNAAPPPTSFILSKTGPGKLVLKYVANNPNLDFDPRAPFVIQLNAQEPLKIEPSIITRENWPKSGNQIDIKYTGASATAENTILGKAAYTVCEHRTKECRHAKVPIELHFK